MLQPDARALLVQVAVGAVVAACAMSSGLSLGFSAIAEEQLRDQDGPYALSESQFSWFASMASIGTPVGCLLGGPLLDALGRRPMLLALNVPFLLGWVLLAAAARASWGVVALLLGRFLTGLATGLASVPATVYLGEMAQARWRGVFVTWTSVAISVGILVVYVVGAACRDDWRVVAWVCAALPVVVVPLLLLVVPESPVWLSQRGRADEAEASLRRLRGVAARPAPLAPAVAAELAALPPPPPPPPPGAAPQSPRSPRRALAALGRPEAWKPLLIMNGFFLFQQITGIYVLVAYAVHVVEKAGVSIDSYTATVVLGGVQVAAGACASFSLARVGRRPLAIGAGVAQTLPLLALAVYLHVGQDNATWLPLTMLVLYVVAGAFGLHTLPWAMVGEVYPARVRGLAAGLTTCPAYLYNFAMLQAYLPLEGAVERGSARGGVEGVFYTFAATSALSVVFVLLWLPETHGRSAQEIEAAFAGRSPAPAPAPAPDDAEKAG